MPNITVQTKAIIAALKNDEDIAYYTAMLKALEQLATTDTYRDRRMIVASLRGAFDSWLSDIDSMVADDRDRYWAERIIVSLKESKVEPQPRKFTDKRTDIIKKAEAKKSNRLMNKGRQNMKLRMAYVRQFIKKK